MKGFALTFLGNPKEGLKLIEKSIQLDPGYSFAWFCRGITLFKFGKIDEGLGDIKLSLMQDERCFNWLEVFDPDKKINELKQWKRFLQLYKVGKT